MLFKGLGVAMITPFKNGEIDYNMTESLIDFWLNNGADCLLPLGTTGEASTITENEKKEYIKFVVERVNKRVAVIVGTGSNSTQIAIKNTLIAEELGADGALIVTPYYNKCTQNGIYSHYRAISDQTKLPIIAYNVPKRTGVNILPQTALKLCEIDGIKGIKEASGDMKQIMETIRLTEDRLIVYSGDDDLACSTMLFGGQGVISVVANVVPYLMSEMVKDCLKRDYLKAAKMQLKLLPLIDSLFCEVNPIPIKSALSLIGYQCNSLRLPLTCAENSTTIRLKNNLIELGVL